MKDSSEYEYEFRPPYEFIAVIGWLLTALVSLSLYNKGIPEAALLPTYIVWGICSFAIIIRSSKGMSIFLNKKRLTTDKIIFIPIEKIKEKITKLGTSETGMWLGEGFLWTREIAQRAYELIYRGEEEVLGEAANDDGSIWIHGVGKKKKKDIFQKIAFRVGHTLIVGTTGAGKTVLFMLMIVQDIFRGEIVIIIDPKGDKMLEKTARWACKLMGKAEKFAAFHPAFPEKSIRFDPLKNWNRATEIASRIASLIPTKTGVSDPFQAFSWMALNDVIQGILAIEEQPTLMLIRKYVEGGIDELLVLALRKHFDEKVKDWESRVAPYLSRFKGDESKAYLEFLKKDAGRDEKATHLEGLIRIFEHNREHYQAMIASLMPILAMLTSSPLDELLSPSEDKEGRILNSAGVIKRGMVLYMGLDSMSDSTVGSAIGSIILSDLTAVAGDRYNYGLDNKPVNIYIDEGAEVINKPTIQLLNKGRGAGFRLIIATQTLADLTVRLGDVSLARQVLGSINNRLILRCTDGETQKYLAEDLSEVKIRSLETQSRTGVASDKTGDINSMTGDTVKDTETLLIPPSMFGKLPNLHLFAKLSNGQVFKTKIPILTNIS